MFVTLFLRKENVVTKILRVAVGLAESGHAARRLRAADFSVPGGRGTAGLSEALRGGDLGSWDASLGCVLQMVSRVYGMLFASLELGEVEKSLLQNIINLVIYSNIMEIDPCPKVV